MTGTVYDLIVKLLSCLENLFEPVRVQLCETLSCIFVNDKKGKMSNSANHIANQLHVYHDPFADTTQQPKIPDGAVNASMGLKSQTVDEITSVAESLDILLYPGLNSCCLIDDCTKAGNSRTYYIPGDPAIKFGAINWSAVVDGITAGSTWSVDNIAMWRPVSVGLQLKLLNADEDNDGWWEAIRVNAEFDTNQYRFTTVNNGTDRTIGTMAPVAKLVSLGGTSSMVNSNSYSTGLLKDLHRVQFECHNKSEDHPFIHMQGENQFDGDTIGSYNAVTVDCSLEGGDDQAADIIHQQIYKHYDMVYLRIHGRAASPGPTSKFHVSVVNNQEIVFDEQSKEHRYQTMNSSIGSMAMNGHSSARMTPNSVAAAKF